MCKNSHILFDNMARIQKGEKAYCEIYTINSFSKLILFGILSVILLRRIEGILYHALGLTITEDDKCLITTILKVAISV